MTQGSNELHFFYDAQNKPAVVVYNDIPYSYIKNLQGDIVAILDSTGTPVVNYVYDAWGRPISCSGIMANTLGKINPFRYRGYVYDEETGLYYLRSRYYVSANARFLNADIMFTNNLFAYCSNNVINCTDPMGTEEEWLEGWIEPLRKSPRWGTAVDGEQMSVFYFVNGLHNMVNDVVDGKKVGSIAAIWDLDMLIVLAVRGSWDNSFSKTAEPWMLIFVRLQVESERTTFPA